MALDSILRGVGSGTGAEVNADNELRVALSTVPTDAGYAKMLDANGNPVIVTENEYLLTSLASLVFFDQVDGTTLNTNVWTFLATGAQLLDQTGGFIRLNSTAITTVSTAMVLQSIKQIPVYGTMPLKVSFNGKVNITPIANATIELGIGTASGTSAPTDGVFFRWTPAGEFRAVINNNGSEVTSAALAAPAANDTTLFDIVVVEDLCQFFLDDTLVAEVACPAANAFPTNAGRLPLLARTINAGSAPATGPQLSIGQVTVDQQCANQNVLWKERLVSLGRGAHQSPTVYTQLPNHANNSTPTTYATLANGTAGYTNLGGRYQFTAPAGGTTDGLLFSFQVPTGYQLFLTGCSISAMNTGAAVATTATILDWSIGVNGSAATLATVDGAGPPQTWSHRRMPLGMQGFVIGAAIGASAPDIVRSFDPPLVADSGRFVAVIVQVPIGTATASQVIRGTVTVNGYFE